MRRTNLEGLASDAFWKPQPPKLDRQGLIAALAGYDVPGAIPVNAPGQFCESCHTYAAVKMDCFECHATVPDARTRTGAAQ